MMSRLAAPARSVDMWWTGLLDRTARQDYGEVFYNDFYQLAGRMYGVKCAVSDGVSHASLEWGSIGVLRCARCAPGIRSLLIPACGQDYGEGFYFCGGFTSHQEARPGQLGRHQLPLLPGHRQKPVPEGLNVTGHDYWTRLEGRFV